MTVPLRVSMKEVPEARALRGTIGTLAERLARACDLVLACDVRIEANRSQRDDEFDVSVELRLAGDKVVKAHDSSHRLDRALYDSFDSARIRLKRYEDARSTTLMAYGVRRPAPA
jgi:hypothetical protein